MLSIVICRLYIKLSVLLSVMVLSSIVRRLFNRIRLCAVLWWRRRVSLWGCRRILFGVVLRVLLRWRLMWWRGVVGRRGGWVIRVLAVLAELLSLEMRLRVMVG